MNADTLFFFEKKPEALPLYEALEARVLSEIEDVHIRVQKTQITFSNRHVFGCASFLPVLKAAQRPPVFLVVTFGLAHPAASPRIAAVTEPYPNRFTHHVVVSSVSEIDDVLLAWLKEAAAFSAGKR